MDICDFSRPYSMWNGVQQYLSQNAGGTCQDGNAAAGWGNPPGSRWTTIPVALWTDNFDVTDCYFKGSYPTGHSVVHEVGRDSTTKNSYNATGGVGGYSGSYGNLVSGSYSNTRRPQTALFPTDWTGATTSYTPSPYDP
jgi:hypothetical protein